MLTGIRLIDRDASLLRPAARTARRFALSLAACASIGIEGGQAQRPDVPSTHGPRDVTRLDVVVQDTDGHPVHGLTESDFVLLVDGKPTRIVDFSGPELGPQSTSESTSQSTPVPEHERCGNRRSGASPGDPEGAPPSTGDGLDLVVFVDEVQIASAARHPAYLALADALCRSLGRNDRVLLISSDSDLQLREPFSDVADVTRVLAVMAKERSPTARLRSERALLEASRHIQQAQNGELARAVARAYASARYTEIDQSLENLTSILTSLQGGRARTVVLYVADGSSPRVGESLFGQAHARFGEASAMIHAAEFDISRRIEEVAARANSAGVALYALDTHRFLAADASESDDPLPGAHVALSDDPPATAEHTTGPETSARPTTLDQMVEATGGILLGEGAQFDSDAGEWFRELRHSYSFGLLLDPPDGRYRRFEAHLTSPRRGWTVRHRTGARSQHPSERISQLLFRTLDFGEQSNPLHAEIVLGRQADDNDGVARVPLTVSFPRTHGLGASHPLRISMVARTRAGYSSIYELIVDTDPLAAPGETESGPAAVDVGRIDLALEPGFVDLAVAIETSSGVVSTLRRGFWVGGGAPPQNRSTRVPLLGVRAPGQPGEPESCRCETTSPEAGPTRERPLQRSIADEGSRP